MERITHHPHQTLESTIQNSPSSPRIKDLLDKMDKKILELMKNPSNENIRKATLILARKKEIQQAVEMRNAASG